MLNVSSKNLLRSVLHTLAYADVFDYPLTAHEVYRYLPMADASFEDVIELLNNTALFSKIEDYYTLHGREQIVKTRKRRARVAGRLWPKATRYGRLITSLPFVRMVAVTGSLAMNNVDDSKDIDIDYLIVTMPNHLWTCRALALMVARFARLEGVSLCPNYLVATNALNLDDHSLYVAHELAQMIPLSGMEIYEEMSRLNGWMEDYLPNALTLPELPPGVRVMQEHFLMQNVLEFLFRLPFGVWFEKWEMD
ncbi:MAG TPA: hypothetical protein VKB04_09865, partial [Anaerolineales bacterium]|nr:hypothetical protein [Anaerolineales bacterium]